jgi:hypothetical protein
MTDGSIRQLAEWVVVLVLTCGAFYLFLHIRDKFYRPPDVLEPDADELMTRIPPRWGK